MLMAPTEVAVLRTASVQVIDVLHPGRPNVPKVRCSPHALL